MRYEFLSQQWIARYNDLRALSTSDWPDAPLVLNLLVGTNAPSRIATNLCVRRDGDNFQLSDGHNDHADLTIRADYQATAVLFAISGDATELINAFATGRILVDGDLGLLSQIQPAFQSQDQSVLDQIREMTAATTTIDLTSEQLAKH